MSTTHNYKKLTIWQGSKNLAKAVYLLSKELPSDEKFGLVSQIRRAAVSIPSNIAEGSKRSTKKDFLQFIRIAEGSAAELETQMILISELFDIDTSKIQADIHSLHNMLFRFGEQLKS